MTTDYSKKYPLIYDEINNYLDNNIIPIEWNTYNRDIIDLQFKGYKENVKVNLKKATINDLIKFETGNYNNHLPDIIYSIYINNNFPKIWEELYPKYFGYTDDFGEKLVLIHYIFKNNLTDIIDSKDITYRHSIYSKILNNRKHPIEIFKILIKDNIFRKFFIYNMWKGVYNILATNNIEFYEEFQPRIESYKYLVNEKIFNVESYLHAVVYTGLFLDRPELFKWTLKKMKEQLSNDDYNKIYDMMIDEHEGEYFKSDKTLNKRYYKSMKMLKKYNPNVIGSN